MSRKSRGKKQKQAVPEEILAEGSAPVEGAVVHVGIDTIAADEPEPVIMDGPATVEELAAAVEELEAAALAADAADAADPEVVEALAADAVAADADAADPVEVADPESLEELTDEEAVEMGAVLPTSAATMDSAQLKHLVEALVFASDKPMTLVRLRQLTRVSDVRRLEQSLAELAEDYKERGIVLQQVSGGFQFRTRTQFSTWVQQLIAGRPVRLSRAQLETLAIIAYRQPITRPEIDEIRGVDSSATLKLLLDRALIRILGKKEEVGRPMLYGTTKEFLDFFSLGDLRELPTLREYSELTDESRQVMTDELGDLDEDNADVPLDEEPIEVEPSIDDMVASYTASIDRPSAPPIESDESAETGVFEAHDEATPFEVAAATASLESDNSTETAAFEADDAFVAPFEVAAATASLEALAARRMAHDETAPDDVELAAAEAAMDADVADADGALAAEAGGVLGDEGVDEGVNEGVDEGGFAAAANAGDATLGAAADASNADSETDSDADADA
ncbi:MAG: SMC-Scp complex subunit ScpB, partial [Deltaproteobacteria bacterium]|nr:SMC-Scp complex subunit ScpB [Deltaproteobacteria bacterium]